jgi:nucleoside 2-deoxyribosyltransferase
VKLYLAGPLFTTPERRWNEALASRLEASGHEVWVPHLHPAPERSARSIFLKDKAGIDWADGVVAITDGPDPDSGTAWECGYAFGMGKPVVLFRGDLRATGDSTDMPYNAMLLGAADAHLELPLATEEEAAAAIAEALSGLEGR